MHDVAYISYIVTIIIVYLVASYLFIFFFKCMFCIYLGR